MFINFSNHPSAKWGDAQKEAARQYGEIVDMPFPKIDPQADNEELSALASEYVAKIKSMGWDCRLTVHVMGEMVFCFMVVNQLKASGIECVASATERNTTDFADGKKLTDFHFVRFRRY